MTQENIPKPMSVQASASTFDLAFALSLTGGLLITIGSVIGIGLASMGRPFLWGIGGMMGGYGMMGQYYYYGTNAYYGMMYGLQSFGIITGVLVIVFALLMRSRSPDSKIYGVLILAFSLVSLIGMGGFFIGALLGVIGGVLALINNPPA